MKLSVSDCMLRAGRRVGLLCCLLVLGGCGVLKPGAPSPTAFYSLDALPGAATVLPVSGNAPSLMISPPRAAAGFDSQRIIYVRQDHRIEYFARSEWVDTPARMLGGLLVTEMSNNGVFRSAAMGSSSAAADMRLVTEIIRLQQEFLGQPSVLRFTLRATLLNSRTQRVLAWREFDAQVAAPSDDPYGGVLAANLAVHQVVREVSAFLAETVRASLGAIAVGLPPFGLSDSRVSMP